MFGKLFSEGKTAKETWVSPLNGKSIPLEEVPDQMFAERMLGDGVAIDPTDGIVTSPIDGEIIQMFPSKHAIGLKSTGGVEILIHIGIETVNLEGEHFISHVTVGDKVKAGDSLITFDYKKIKEQASIITPIIVTNGDSVNQFKELIGSQVVSGKTEIATYKVAGVKK